MHVCVCTLAKSRKKSQIKFGVFFPTSFFFLIILFYFKGSYCVWGGVKGFFFLLFFCIFFSFSLFVSFKGNYSPWPFQLSNATKGNPASFLPCPHTRLFLQQKLPLLGRVIISQGSFSIPQVRNASLLYIKATSHKYWETRDVAADALPTVLLPRDNCRLDKLGSDRHSECFLFLQAGCLTCYMSWLSIYLQYIPWH